MADELVDYYAEFEIADDADKSAIEKRLAAERRKWRGKQGDPDPDVNYLASKKMQWIAEAKETLLDPARRAAYDTKVEAWRRRQKAASSGGSGATIDWYSRAQHDIANNNLDSALQAAEEFFKLDQTNPDALLLKAEVHAKRQEFDEASFFARVAADSYMDNSEILNRVVSLLFSVHDYQDAEGTCRVLMELEPGNLIHAANTAIALSNQERTYEAISLMRSKLEQHPEDCMLQSLTAELIVRQLEGGLGVSRSGEPSIVSREQLDRARQCLEELERLDNLDETNRARVEKLEADVEFAGQKKTDFPLEVFLPELFKSVLKGIAAYFVAVLVLVTLGYPILGALSFLFGWGLDIAGLAKGLSVVISVGCFIFFFWEGCAPFLPKAMYGYEENANKCV